MIEFDQLLALLEAGDDVSLIRATELVNAIMPDYGATLDPDSTIAPESTNFAIELSRLVSDDSPLSQAQRDQLQPFLNDFIKASSSKLSTIDQANEDLGTDSHVIERELANRNFDDTLAITRFLAEGGLGKVWVAKDHAVQREIVLKQLRDASAGDTTKDRFLHEAQVTAGLEHPNIVPVYGLNADIEGQPYYTMKYVRGDTFADMIERHHEATTSVNDLNQLFDVFQHICNAVSYAHSRGIIHRDLKPENIAIGEFGEVLVLDWGLAKRLKNTSTPATDASSTLSNDQSRHGRVMGTPNYMAPEQARGATDEMDERTDIYALGAILFEVLTGRPPRYKGERAKDIRTVLNDIQAGHIPGVRELAPSVPKRLESICLKALEVSNADRYQTVADLRHDLMAFRNYLPVKAHRESFIEKTRRLIARHRLITSVTLIASLIFASGSLGYSLFENYAHNTAKIANRQIDALSTSTAQKHVETESQLRLAEESRATAESRQIEAERDAASASFLSNAAREKRQERAEANNQAETLAEQAREDEESSRINLSKAARSAEVEKMSLSQAQLQFIENINLAFSDSINRLSNTFTEHFPTQQVFEQLQTTRDLAYTLETTANDSSASELFQYVTSEFAATLPELTRIATPGPVHAFTTTPDGLTVAYTDNSANVPSHRIGQISESAALSALPFIPENSIDGLYAYPDNTCVIQFHDEQGRFIQHWDLSASQALSSRIEIPVNAKLTTDRRHSYIVIAHTNGAILFDTKTGTRRILKLALSGEVSDAACDSNATVLGIATNDGSVYWLDLRSKTIKRYRLPHPTSRLSHHVDGSLYFATETGYLYRWRHQMATPEVLVRGTARDPSVTSFDEQLRHFCLVKSRTGATIHRLASGTSVDILPQIPFNDAKFAPNGKFIALRTIDGQLAIANSETGALLLPLTKHGHGILHFEFAEDSSYLISLDQNGVLRQWQWSNDNPHIKQFDLPSPINNAWSIAKNNELFTLSDTNTLTRFITKDHDLTVESAVTLDFSPSFIAQLDPHTIALSGTRYAVFEGSHLIIQDDFAEELSGVVIRDHHFHVVTGSENIYKLNASHQWIPIQSIVQNDEVIYPLTDRNRVVPSPNDTVIQLAAPLSHSASGDAPFMSYSLDANNTPRLSITPTGTIHLPLTNAPALGFIKLQRAVAIINSNSIALHAPVSDLRLKAASYLDSFSDTQEANEKSPIAEAHLKSASMAHSWTNRSRSTPPLLSENVAATLQSPLVDPNVLDLINDGLESQAFQPSTQKNSEFTNQLATSAKLAITNTATTPIQLDSLSFNSNEPITTPVAHVRIQSLSEMSRLAITEIELYDGQAAIIPITNSSCSSSTGVGRPANAYDGGKDADINRGRTTFVSQNEFRPWIEFTLESPSLIHRVLLHNTSDLSLKRSITNAIVQFYDANRKLLGSFTIESLPDPELSIDTTRPPSLILANAIILSPGKRPAYLGFNRTSTNLLRTSVTLEPNASLAFVMQPESARTAENIRLIANSADDASGLSVVAVPASYRMQTAPAPSEITSYFDRLKLHGLIAENDIDAAYNIADTLWQQATDAQQLHDQLFYAKYLVALAILSGKSPMSFQSQLVATLNSGHSTSNKLLLFPFLTCTALSLSPESVPTQELLEDSTASASARLLGLATYGYITEQHAKNIRLIRDPASAPEPTSILTALIQTMVLNAMEHESIDGARSIRANLILYMHNHLLENSDSHAQDWPYQVLLSHLLENMATSQDPTKEQIP